MSPCDRPGCASAGTHTFTVTRPGGVPEVRHLCRRHERAAKDQLRRSIPRHVPAPSPPPPRPLVRCSRCDAVVPATEDGVSGRSPCGTCGSTQRTVFVFASDELHVHEAVDLRKTPVGATHPTMKLKSGDDFTRDHQAWGVLKRNVDRESGRYREDVTYYDGTTFVSEASLADHEKGP